ncbi:unnamed protein product [Haemonchus placei]|uniref:Uncharacterized protein n=1 Tax=Haemonchus placei TaxID=6290 RepID=A0A3P7YNX2_HAEPC|nr:unnamed protein product [Haemonchus placei]
MSNPCKVAKAIAYPEDQGELVPPMVLVGIGAEEWAEKRGEHLSKRIRFLRLSLASRLETLFAMLRERVDSYVLYQPMTDGSHSSLYSAFHNYKVTPDFCDSGESSRNGIFWQTLEDSPLQCTSVLKFWSQYPSPQIFYEFFKDRVSFCTVS